MSKLGLEQERKNERSSKKIIENLRKRDMEDRAKCSTRKYKNQGTMKDTNTSRQYDYQNI